MISYYIRYNRIQFRIYLITYKLTLIIQHILISLYDLRHASLFQYHNTTTNPLIIERKTARKVGHHPSTRKLSGTNIDDPNFRGEIANWAMPEDRRVSAFIHLSMDPRISLYKSAPVVLVASEANLDAPFQVKFPRPYISGWAEMACCIVEHNCSGMFQGMIYSQYREFKCSNGRTFTCNLLGSRCVCSFSVPFHFLRSFPQHKHIVFSPISI